MTEQDRKSHPVDKFIHALYSETQDRYSGYGKYPDKSPTFGDLVEFLDALNYDKSMLQFHNLRQEYRQRGVESLSQHPFRGHATLLNGQTVACDSVDGEIDCLCGCGHKYSAHFDDDGGGEPTDNSMWVLCSKCGCGQIGR